MEAVGTRAVLAQIPAGNLAVCPVCDGEVKFNAKLKPNRVICNIYDGGKWDRMVEYHEHCYRGEDCPYGEPIVRPRVMSTYSADRRRDDERN